MGDKRLVGGRSSLLRALVEERRPRLEREELIVHFAYEVAGVCIFTMLLGLPLLAGYTEYLARSLLGLVLFARCPESQR